MPFKFFSKEGFERVTALANQDVELDYVAKTTDSVITATTEGTANTVVEGNARTYDGQTKVKLEFFFPWSGTSVNNVNVIYFIFMRGSTVLGRSLINVSTGAAGPLEPGGRTITLLDTPPAGSHAYTVKAYINGGNSATIYAGAGGSGNYLPAFLRVSRVTQQVTTFPEAVMEVSDGDVPVWDASSQSWLGKGGQVLLWDSVDAGVSLPTASITTPTLSQAFKHLLVEIVARGDTGALYTSIYCTINNDTGANYHGEAQQLSGAAWSNQINNPTLSSLYFGEMPAGSASVGCSGVVSVKLLNYIGSLWKEASFTNGFATGGAVNQQVLIAGMSGWENVAAITSLQFKPGAGNFVAGTRISVYGIG